MLCSKQYIIENNFNLIQGNKGITYGKFKLTEAYKQLINNISKGYHDKSQLWSIQINISYEFNKLIYKLIDYYFTYINICNLNIVHLIFSDNLIYNLEVLKYYKENKHIINTYHNHQIIRNHLAQFVSVLTLSDKKKIPTLEKITKEQLFLNNTSLKQRIKYSGNNLTSKIIKCDDDQNIIIPINEIINILKNNDKQIFSESHLLFWLNWLFEYDKLYFKPNSIRKLDQSINDKFIYEMVWILWEILLNYGNYLPNNIIKKLLFIYCIDFKPSQKNKKKNIIIMAFLIILNTNNTININKSVYNNYELTMNTVLNINPMYEKVKNI